MLDSAKVPSLGTLAYLRLVQASDANYAKFLDSNWSKMIPDKPELEFQQRFKDDGRKIFARLEQFEREIRGESDEQVRRR